MRRLDSILTTLFCSALLLVTAAGAEAQTGARITFGINPAVFRAGQPASAELSVSSVSSSVTLSTGSSFSFFVDSSLGTVQSVTSPIAVESSSLLASDFSVGFTGGQNPVVVTYNGSAKSFAIGDSFSMKVSLIASAHAGPGKLSLSSQLVSAVNGALPFTTASIVDFANSGTSAVTHDQSLTGDGTQPTPLGIAPGGVTNADIADGAVTAPKIAAGQVVKSLNGLEDAISILGGTNVTVTPGAGTLTVSAPSLLSSVAHDATLAGNGSSAAPLGVAPQGVGTAQLADNSVTSAKIGPGQVGTTQLATGAVTTAQLANNAVTTTQLADNSVTAGKIASFQVVKTLNGFTDNVSLATDSNLQIFTEAILPTGGILHLSAPNMLTSVAHDATITGNGTSGSPLSVVAAAAAPTQQFVEFSTSFSVTDNSLSSLSFPTVTFGSVFTVPQGQRLVITQVMATVENLFAGQQHVSAFMIINQTASSQGNILPIAVTEQSAYGDANPSTGVPVSNAFGGSQQVTIFLHAGETVQFGASKGSAHGQADCNFFFYGYLVAAP